MDTFLTIRFKILDKLQTRRKCSAHAIRKATKNMPVTKKASIVFIDIMVTIKSRSHILCAYLVLFIFAFRPVFAERYKIQDVSYSTDGITRESAVNKKIKVDTKRIFDSEEEYASYIEDLRQRFCNERNFNDVKIEYSISSAEEDGVHNVHLHVSLFETKHLVILPYPKYNSNSGLQLKLKAKDTNFFGTLTDMSFDLSAGMENKKDDDDNDTGETDFIYGLALDFDLPFEAGPFDIDWLNNWQATYTEGDSSPEWNAATGIRISLPFERFSLVADAKQGATRDWDYEEYDDDTYFTEYASFSVPVIAGNIDDWGDILWTPRVSYELNWDEDGINEDNEEIRQGAVYGADYTVKTERVDWEGNFRHGASFMFNQGMGYDIDKEEMLYRTSAEIKLYTASNRAGLAIDALAFYNDKAKQKIGQRLRGIKDDQKYGAATKYGNHKALFAEAAIVLNVDVPIRLFTIDFDKTRLSSLHTFNCEVQASPFFDIAFTKNDATERTFSPKDAFYAGGLEILVYPEKWRSLVLRGSCGFDIGRMFFKDNIDTDWRRDVSKYEIEIGIGLHY